MSHLSGSGPVCVAVHTPAPSKGACALIRQTGATHLLSSHHFTYFQSSSRISALEMGQAMSCVKHADKTKDPKAEEATKEVEPSADATKGANAAKDAPEETKEETKAEEPVAPAAPVEAAA